MPRAKRYMTWRISRDEVNDCSEDSQLQALSLYYAGGHWGRRWITVARGDPESLRDIADALNKARFSLFDLSVPHDLQVLPERKPAKRELKSRKSKAKK